jgi:hypothetical protein
VGGIAARLAFRLLWPSFRGRSKLGTSQIVGLSCGWANWSWLQDRLGLRGMALDRHETRGESKEASAGPDLGRHPTESLPCIGLVSVNGVALRAPSRRDDLVVDVQAEMINKHDWVVARMKSVVCSRTGDPSVLRLVDRDVTEPGAGEVRVRTVVSGVTRPTGSRGLALAMVRRRTPN